MLFLMDHRALEREIDRLYQLPPGEFTAARNALAKQAGPDAARVRALDKPPVAAWAVNQLYWRRRDAWDALVAAAEEARRAHKAVLSGRAADIRAAGQIQEESVEAAVKATLALLAEAGHPATDATRSAIATTLRALPAEEPAGRLTRTLQPAGFEALAGLSIAGGRKTTRPAPKPEAPQKARAAPHAKLDVRALARARAAAAGAERELRAAEHAAKREEFEIAKATRDERRAEEAVDRARQALERAQAELKEAEAAATGARRTREAAEARSRRAESAVAAARERASSAADTLKKYS